MNILVFNCGSSSQGFTVFHRNEKSDPDILIFGTLPNGSGFRSQDRG